MRKVALFLVISTILIAGSSFVLASKWGSHTPPYNGSPIENNTTPFPVQNMTQNKTQTHNTTMLMNETKKHKHKKKMHENKCGIEISMTKEELQIIEQYSSLLTTEKMVLEKKLFGERMKLFALRMELMTATRNSGEDKNLTLQIREELSSTEKEIAMYSALIGEINKQMSIVSRLEYAGMMATVKEKTSVKNSSVGGNGSMEVSVPFPRILPVIPSPIKNMPSPTDIAGFEAEKLSLAFELINKASNNYTKIVGEYLAKSTAMEIEKFNISVSEQMKEKVKTAMEFNVSDREVEAIIHNCPEIKRKIMPIVPEPMPIILPVIPPILHGIEHIISSVGIHNFGVFVPKIAI